jgi:tetratricopeptide (TPR) repeat protein
LRVELDDLLQQALDRGNEGDWEGMAEELGEALEQVPGDPTVLCWLGVAERELGLSSSAYDRFKEALGGAPDDPHVLATIGTGLAQFDDPDAEAALRSASVMAPGLALARWMFGAYLSREGLFQDALRELEAAASLAPDDATVAYELGVAYALMGEMEKALDALARSVDLASDDGWNEVVMGLVEAELGRFEEAARDLSQGARLRPEDVEAQLLAALAAEAAGLEDLAFEMLERARQGAEAGDQPLLDAVEGRLYEGTTGSADLLGQEILPGALRERLMTRP